MYSRAGLSTGASHARTPPTHGHGNGRPCGPRLQAFRQSDSEQPGPWRTADLILPFAFRFGRGRTHGPCRLQQEEQEPSRDAAVPGPARRPTAPWPLLLATIRSSVGYASLYTPPTTSPPPPPPAQRRRPHHASGLADRSPKRSPGLVVAEWRSDSANLGGRGGHQACCRCPLPGDSLLIQSFWRPGLAWISTPF